MKIALWVKFDRTEYGKQIAVDAQYADEEMGGVPPHRMGYDFQGWFDSWDEAEAAYAEMTKEG